MKVPKVLWYNLYKGAYKNQRDIYVMRFFSIMMNKKRENIDKTFLHDYKVYSYLTCYVVKVKSNHYTS